MHPLRPTLASILILLFLFPIEAKAQNVERIILGIIGSAIEENAKKKEQEELEKQQRKELKQRLKATQTALATMGFYKSTIDGVDGPGTRRALQAYMRAFEIPQFNYEPYEIQNLQEYAASGFRSVEEIRRANVGNFTSRAELVAATNGGFRTASEWKKASRLGFSERSDYSAFTSSGFADADSYRAARKAGFSSKKEYDAAISAGFQTKKEFAEFKRSGHEDREAFLEAKELEQTAINLVSVCERASVSENAIGALKDCAAAIMATDRRLVLIGKFNEAYDASLKQDPDTRAGNDEELVGLNACIEPLADQRDEDALETCEKIASANQAHEGLQTGYSILRERIDNLRQKAEAERLKLAIEDARTRAPETIDAVQEFIRSGRSFGEPITIARAVAEVRQSLEADEHAQILQSLTKLEQALESETSFKDYVAKLKEGEELKIAQATDKALSQFNRYSAFIEAHIAQNITSPDIPKLIDLNDRVKAIIRLKNTNSVLASLSGIETELKALRLLSAAKAHELPEDNRRQEIENKLATAESTQLQLATVTQAADLLIEDIQAFTEAGRRLSDPISIARAVIKLRGAKEASDLDGLNLAFKQLKGLTENDGELQSFMAERQAARDAADSDSIQLAKAEAEALEKYLVEFMSTQPLDNRVAELLKLQDTLNDSRATGTASTILASVAKGKANLESLGLQDSFRDFKARIEVEGATSRTRQASNGLAITALNEALLEGDPNDILILENKTGKAPHLRRNLKGELVFEDQTASTCWAHREVDLSLGVGLAQKSIKDEGAENLVNSGRCAPNRFSEMDAVLLKRGSFLLEPLDYASSLVDAFESGQFVILNETLWSNVRRRAESEHAQGEENLRGLTAETKTGWGFLLLDQSGGSICVGHDDDWDEELHLSYLKSVAGELGLWHSGLEGLESGHHERIFQRALRNGCGIVYSDAASLNQLVSAFDREKVDHRVMGLWASNEDLEKIAAVLASNAADKEQQIARLRQEAEAAATLATEKAQDSERVRRLKQEQLQAEYSQEAAAALKRLDRLVSDAVEQNFNGNLQFSRLFSDVTDEMRGRFADRWEITDHELELADYGTGNWSGRRLEAVTGILSVSLENRILGERLNVCRELSILIDDEFGMLRDSSSNPCNEAQSLAAWQTGIEFESRWLAN